MTLDLALQAAVSGLLMGGIYALIALGYFDVDGFHTFHNTDRFAAVRFDLAFERAWQAW